MCVCPNMKQICFSGIFITATVLCFVSDVCTATFYSDNSKFQVLDTKDIYSTVEETSSSKPEDRSKIWNKVPTILQMAFKILYFFGFFDRSIILPISLILDYSFVENTYCEGENIEIYLTLKIATLACNQNNECGVITDYDCDGGYWTTCRGNHLESSSSRKSCSWIRPRFGKFNDFQIIPNLIMLIITRTFVYIFMCTFHFMYLWYVDYKEIVKPLEALLREVNVYFHFRTKVRRIRDALRWIILDHRGVQSHTIIIVLMLSTGVTVAKDVKCKVYPKNFCIGKDLFLLW